MWIFLPICSIWEKERWTVVTIWLEFLWKHFAKGSTAWDEQLSVQQLFLTPTSNNPKVQCKAEIQFFTFLFVEKKLVVAWRAQASRCLHFPSRLPLQPTCPAATTLSLSLSFKTLSLSAFLPLSLLLFYLSHSIFFSFKTPSLLLNRQIITAIHTWYTNQYL